VSEVSQRGAHITPLPHRGLAATWHPAAEQEQGEEASTDSNDPGRIISLVPFAAGAAREVDVEANGPQWVGETTASPSAASGRVRRTSRGD
jgi:hypothetical protein